jgi:phosphatidylserine/phosphatidylglycerophosphate/cardiolipin synthase-like enzyme/uncharacterized membrane protein YdjX (TVP38/TMEM64 family)
METERICKQERNCWRIAAADRVNFLIDGDAYFSTLAAALERAQRSIFIAGWQLDSRMRLTPQAKKAPVFGDFLHQLVRRNRALHVYVLLWDFAMIYATDREILPLYSHPWRTHSRIHFWLDSNHPVGGSHHQKIVVIDDAVAFAGGQDLAERRWDTSDHAAQDPRRVDSAGVLYPPYHDVQLMVDGDAAAALGELVRERWQQATGECIPIAPAPGRSPWPALCKPHLTTAAVAISRTQPACQGRGEVREIEALNLDSIRAARRLIYIENQYLTSATVGEALAARLREKDGPEIVMVLPSETTEWLERVTMAVLRARLLKRLREADQFRRLHVYYPFVQSEANEIRVHAKVMIVDDTLARVGSANLNNRSMGLDTECDLAVEALNHASGAAIVDFRNRLLGEHLGVAPEKVARQHDQDQSLASAIEHLRGGDRMLRELDPVVSEHLEQMIPAALMLDPERAREPQELVDLFFPMTARRRAAPGLVRLSVLLSVLAMLILFWRSTPLAAWIDAKMVNSWTSYLAESPLAPLWVAGVFTVGSLILTPVTLLIVATAVAFGPWLGFAYALGGSVISAGITYGIGKLLGKGLVRRFAGATLQRVQRQISRHGFFSMLFARVVPIAPFVIVNFVAGANGFRLRDFMLATVAGMTPGILTLVILEDQFERLLRDPTAGRFALLLGLAIFFAFLAWGFYRWVSRRRAARAFG